MVIALVLVAHAGGVAAEKWHGKLATFSPGGTYLAYLDGDNGLRIVDERKNVESPPAQIDQLLGQLDSPKFHERNQAFLELRKLGPAIENQIESRLRAAPSLEVEQRLKALQQRFAASEGFRPRRQVRQLVFSPNEEFLALAGEDRTVSLWRSGSGQQEDVIGSFESTIYSLAFSPDGDWLTIGTGNGAVFVCDIRRRVLVQELTGHTSAVMSLRFSPDGKRLYSAGGFDRRIGVWDATDLADFRKAPRRWLGWLNGHQDSVLCLAVSSDGGTLASGGYDNAILIWELARGQIVRKITGHANAIRVLCFTADGKRLISGADDGTIFVWDCDSPSNRETIRPEIGGILSVSLAVDGTRMAISGNTNNVVMWKLPRS
jgi:WD40 repeat protein